MNIYYILKYIWFQWLVDRARSLIATMTGNIAKISRKFNRDICTKYDTILKNIMALSETTEDLVKQTAYVENLRTGELMVLRVSVRGVTQLIMRINK